LPFATSVALFVVVGDKDVMLAFLGASAGLAGLILVFLGIVVAAYQAFPVGTQQDVLNRYRAAACSVVVAFLSSVIVVGLAAAWLLLNGGNAVLFHWTAVAFFAQLALLLMSCVWVLWRVLWTA